MFPSARTKGNLGWGKFTHLTKTDVNIRPMHAGLLWYLPFALCAFYLWSNKWIMHYFGDADFELFNSEVSKMQPAKPDHHLASSVIHGSWNWSTGSMQGTLDGHMHYTRCPLQSCILKPWSSLQMQHRPRGAVCRSAVRRLCCTLQWSGLQTSRLPLIQPTGRDKFDTPDLTHWPQVPKAKSLRGAKCSSSSHTNMVGE